MIHLESCLYIVEETILVLTPNFVLNNDLDYFNFNKNERSDIVFTETELCLMITAPASKAVILNLYYNYSLPLAKISDNSNYPN